MPAPRADDQRGDPAARPADRAQDPDLPHALEDRHRHRVRDADPADDQREQRDDPARLSTISRLDGVDLDALARLGDTPAIRGSALSSRVATVLAAAAERTAMTAGRHLAGPLGELLDDAQRQDDAGVHEARSPLW